MSENGDEIRTNTADFRLESEQNPPKDGGGDGEPLSSSPPSLPPMKEMSVELVDATEGSEMFPLSVERAEAGNVAQLDLPKSTVSDEIGVAFDRIDLELARSSHSATSHTSTGTSTTAPPTASISDSPRISSGHYSQCQHRFNQASSLTSHASNRHRSYSPNLPFSAH